MRALPIACVVHPTSLALLDPAWADTRALTGHPAGLGHLRQAGTDAGSSPIQIRYADVVAVSGWAVVGWKVSTNGQAVVGQTACRSWRSGIVVDPWGRRRVRRSRFESGHQHHVQLLAGGVGDQCAIAASRRSTVRIADGTGRAAWIPRIVAGSAPADSRGAAEQATISAVL
jgi:hypothetical protein